MHMGGQSIRFNGGFVQSDLTAKQCLEQLAAKAGMSQYGYASKVFTELYQGNIHFAENCPTGHDVQSQNLQKPEQELGDVIVANLNAFVESVKTMDKKTIMENLIDLQQRKKRDIKAANDSGMYGADSWAHFLEAATTRAISPHEMVCETARHFMTMILAAVYRGQPPEQIMYELNQQHLMRGRSWKKSYDGKMPLHRYGSAREFNQREFAQDEKVLH